jgi:hypothetical protein
MTVLQASPPPQAERVPERDARPYRRRAVVATLVLAVGLVSLWAVSGG